jgi:hypothetical protein
MNKQKKNPVSTIDELTSVSFLLNGKTASTSKGSVRVRGRADRKCLSVPLDWCCDDGPVHPVWEPLVSHGY